VCQADFLCSSGYCGSATANGHYGGGYGVSSSLAGQFSTSNPNLYWDLLCFSHEIGHNFNSRHTHCYSPPVDQCYASEAGCYSGQTSVPPEKGTIMSYCHLLSGGYDNIKLFLSVPGEPSGAVYTVMRTFVESHTSCLSAVATQTVPAINPNVGPMTGGTTVQIYGSNFQAGATVTIGGASAPTTFVSSTLLSSTTPARPVGPADVVVTNPGGGNTTSLPGGFVYTATGLPPQANSITPCRVIDTRIAASPFGGPPLSAGQVRSFTIPSGSCPIPADAAGVVLNITVSDATAPGTLTLYPGTGPTPGTNTISFVTGKNRANNVVLGLVGGAMSVKNFQSTGSVNLIIDVNSYFR
jgi:hypothetical protein